MRCYICNKVIDEPTYNQDHQDYDPCDTCRVIIEDLLASYEDQPSDPDLADDVIIEGLYPQTCDPFGTQEET